MNNSIYKYILVYLGHIRVYTSIYNLHPSYPMLLFMVAVFYHAIVYGGLGSLFSSFFADVF